MKMKAALFAALAVSLLCTACVFITQGEGNNFLDSELRGTWETNTPTSPTGYTGTLEIGFSTITIKGFSGSGVSAANKPFNGFTRDTTLQAYAEKKAVQDPDLIDPAYDGTLYIANQGKWQSGIDFTYWREGELLSYSHFISITFGSQPLILKKLVKSGSASAGL